MQGYFATSAVPGTRFTDLRWVAETGSTNADLLRAAAEGAAEGLVLVADHQSAGRGRLDRTWVAPAGSSLLVSVLLRPRLSPQHLFLLTTAAGLASVEAVDTVAGLRCGLKWPNDLVAVGPGVADRKLSGVLAESMVTDGHVSAVVVGMGLNVNWPEQLPEELAATATSVNRLIGHPVDREALLVEWLRRLDHWIERLGDGSDAAGRGALLEAVRSRSATLGRRVRVQLAVAPDAGAADGPQEIEGTAVMIDDEGHLQVAVDGAAEPLVVAVGDVVHLRPVS